MPEELTLTPAESSPAADSPAEPLESSAPAETPTHTPPLSGYASSNTPAEVPFHEHPRWKEVLAERDANKNDAELARAYLPVLEQFRQQGYTNAEAVQEALRQQEEQQYQESLRNQYQQRVNDGELDPELANREYALTLKEREVETALSQVRTHQVSETVSRLVAQYPSLDKDLIADTLTANPNADVAKLAARTHSRTEAIKAAAIAEYTGKKAADSRLPSPEAGGGSPAPGLGQRPAESKSWVELLGVTAHK